MKSLSEIESSLREKLEEIRTAPATDLLRELLDIIVIDPNIVCAIIQEAFSRPLVVREDSEEEALTAVFAELLFAPVRLEIEHTYFNKQWQRRIYLFGRDLARFSFTDRCLEPSPVAFALCNEIYRRSTDPDAVKIFKQHEVSPDKVKITASRAGKLNNFADTVLCRSALLTAYVMKLCSDCAVLAADKIDGEGMHDAVLQCWALVRRSLASVLSRLEQRQAVARQQKKPVQRPSVVAKRHVAQLLELASEAKTFSAQNLLKLKTTFIIEHRVPPAK